MPFRPISRRTLLRGAGGVCIALPFLEAMLPRRAKAQEEIKRFIAFFYPNGTDPRLWNPAVGALSAETLTECLQDLSGFAAEGEYPAGDSIVSDITLITGTDHSGVSPEIHQPSLALSAHKGVVNNYTPPETLDQHLADRLAADTPFRLLTFSATGSTDVTQGHISFNAAGQETPIRDPAQAFDTLFGSLEPNGDGPLPKRHACGKRACSMPSAKTRHGFRAGWAAPIASASTSTRLRSGSSSSR